MRITCSQIACFDSIDDVPSTFAHNASNSGVYGA